MSFNWGFIMMQIDDVYKTCVLYAFGMYLRV